MTESDSTTPRLDALRNARIDGADATQQRTRNQVAPADEVLAAPASRTDDTIADPTPQTDEAAARDIAEQLDAEGVTAAGDEDDLPGSTYQFGATPLLTDRLLAADDNRRGSTLATPPVADEATAEVAVAEDAPATQGSAALPLLDPADVEVVETEPTDLVEEAPKAVDAPVATAPAAAIATPVIAPLFRDERTTTVEADAPAAAVTTQEAPVESEAEKTAVIDRDAEREARAKRLGIVAAPAPAAEPVVAVAKPARTTDKWHGSLGLFLLRLVTGLLLITQGWAHLSHWTQTQEFFARSVLPQPMYFALGVTIAEIVAGVLLIVGLATRLAGLLLVAIEAILLGFFIYGKSGAIFTPGEPGFKGDIEILLAAIGLLFLLLGGGGLALDRIFRRNRARAREERLLGNTV